MQTIDLRQHKIQGRRLRAGHFVLLTALASLAALLAGALQYHQHEQRQRAIATASAEVAQARQALEDFQAANPGMTDLGALEQEIERLSAQRTTRRQLLTNLQRSTGARPYSYDEFLRTLSEQRLDGVWLTAFSLDNRPEIEQVRVRLRGQTESPGLLPQYLDRLRGGTTTRLNFDDLRLQQLDDDSEFYRFSLESRGMSDGTSGGRP